MNLLEKLRSIFINNDHSDILENRPAFVYHIDDYYARKRLSFKGLIINLKKEVKEMDAKSMVEEQLAALTAEKEALVAQVVEADKEQIEAVKVEAAKQAEALYIKGIQDKVATQFRVAEGYLTELLQKLSAEETEELQITKEEEISAI